MQENSYRNLTLLSLIILLPVLVILATALGAKNLNFGELWHVFLRTNAPQSVSLSLAKVMVWELRLPRILLSALLGAALGCAGVITQALFRNPLASPDVLGVNSGGAMFVVLGMSFGLDEQALWATPLLAAAGAMFSMLLLYALGSFQRQMVSLLLIGVALASLFSALISLLTAFQVEDYAFGLKVSHWLLGSFEGRSWNFVHWSLPALLPGFILAFTLLHNLDVLHLGIESAHTLGINQRRTYIQAILAISILVGTATAMVGLIAFIALIVPHIARTLVGAMHAHLLPASTLLGGILLLLVDTLSRIIDINLPPSVISSLLGAPFFLWLLHKYKSMA